jgi:hypothetical protein
MRQCAAVQHETDDGLRKSFTRSVPYRPRDPRQQLQGSSDNTEGNGEPGRGSILRSARLTPLRAESLDQLRRLRRANLNEHSP